MNLLKEYRFPWLKCISEMFPIYGLGHSLLVLGLGLGYFVLELAPVVSTTAF